MKLKFVLEPKSFFLVFFGILLYNVRKTAPFTGLCVEYPNVCYVHAAYRL